MSNQAHSCRICNSGGQKNFIMFEMKEFCTQLYIINKISSKFVRSPLLSSNTFTSRQGNNLQIKILLCYLLRMKGRQGWWAVVLGVGWWWARWAVVAASGSGWWAVGGGGWQLFSD